MAEPILELNKVTVRRGMSVVLENFSLKIAAGECVILHGSNGLGKSTVIETAARLLPMETGSVRHHGKLVMDSEGRRISPIRPFGLTLQTNCLVGSDTTQQHLATISALNGKSIDIHPLLELYDIANRRNDLIAHLSGGQQRKLSVISGMLPGFLNETPQLIMLDEPDSGLDDAAINQLIDNIHQLRNLGHALLIATHNSKLFECATSMCSITKTETKQPKNNLEWSVSASPYETKFVRLKTGLRYNLSTLVSIQRNWLAGLLVLGTLLTIVDPLVVSDHQLMLMGFTLAPAFTMGLVGDAVLKIMNEQRTIDWWRAQHNRLPNSYPETLISGILVTTIAMTIFLESLDYRVIVIGGLITFITTFCVRFLQLSTVRLARKNAVYVRLLTPILILPWGLVVDYCSRL